MGIKFGHFRRATAVAAALACGWARAEEPAGAGPATQPGSAFGVSVIRGVVKAEGEVPLSEMVVYLEPTDAGRQLPPPGPVQAVSQKGAQFEPKLLVITVGQTVEFVNDEDRAIEHNVFSNSAVKRFDLGLYGPGQKKTVTFDKVGPVFLYCSVHRYMDGVIYVCPTPFFSRVEENGQYEMANVPAGTWVIKTWQRRKRFVEQSVPVTLEAGKPADVGLELKKKS